MDSAENPNSDILASPRICLFSQRHLQRLVSRCAEYEFEDIICDADDVELLAPEPGRIFAVGQKVAKLLAENLSGITINPGAGKVRLTKDYDLFFMICQFPSDLLALNAVKGWKQRCRTSVCWLSELWAGQLHKWRGCLKVLRQFDHVIMPCKATVEPLSKLIRQPCFHLPPGIDARLFCPYPNPPVRFIDVYNMGRRSPIKHQALLRMAEEKQIFYVYDTIRKMDTLYPSQHRSLVANIAKRSRYFLANMPKFDRQFETNGQSEISYRFFEGAAAGAVMIGQRPTSETFKDNFDWPDAVIPVPFDAPNIAEILADLNAQPDRLKEIRRNNMINCLLRHDWAYRWKNILDITGLKPMPGLAARERRLKELADEVKKLA